jgi:hypothetical protein
VLQTRARALFAIFVLLAAALALAGCSSGDLASFFFRPAGLGGAGTPAFAIVANAQAKELDTFYIVPDSGHLAQLPLVEPIRGIPVVGDPLANLIEPDLRTLVDNAYVIVEHDGGALGIQTIDITIAYDGMADFPQYPINVLEAPLPKSGPVSLTGMATAEDNTGTTGEFLYAVDGGEVSGYSIDHNTAALTPIAGLPSSFGTMTAPTALAVTTTEKVIVAEPNALHVLALDANTGALTESGAPLPVSVPADGALATTPDARFVYASSTSTNQIEGYALAENGVLTPLASGPVATDSGPVQIVIDPTGKMLYSFNAIAHTVTGYSIAAGTGALTAVGQPFPAGGRIGGGAIDPSARFLYLTDCDHGTIVELGINADGTLLGPETTKPHSGGACGPVILMQKYCPDLHRAC